MEQSDVGASQARVPGVGMDGRVVKLVALVLVVLAGPMVAVAARSVDAAPVSFTGWVHPPGNDCGEGATSISCRAAPIPS